MGVQMVSIMKRGELKRVPVVDRKSGVAIYKWRGVDFNSSTVAYCA